ncbi:OprO/OprP family phosphate-selective porin [Parabacteroides sp. OttesenSCG-928-N08]|nr:OprO/OprP family phosphate-selective porin [Parabacteroides sp. OttesenSCG-928-N08]
MKQIRLHLIALCLLLSVPFTVWGETSDEPLSNEQTIPEKGLKLLRNLTLSGYIQGQYQYGQEAASLKVGSKNEKSDEAFNRVGIRLGRLKVIYNEGIASGVFQIDMTEKGINLKDAYLNIYDPWLKTNALRVGLMEQPFGYEISYSSATRESAERATVIQTLFPAMCDLGAMVILRPATTSPLHFLQLQAALVAGNGNKRETDSKRDFIAHLIADKQFGGNFSLAGGLSYYRGSVYQGTQSVYRMEGNSFVLTNDPNQIGEYAKREYMGADLRVGFRSLLGNTKITGEYLFGQQPGIKGNSKSPNSASLPTEDTYIRPFRGGYVMCAQSLGSLPLSVVVKYDWYDPNTKVSGDEIGVNHTGAADLTVSTWGTGLFWDMKKYLRLLAYYEFVSNEKSEKLTGYAGNVKDNVFTLRLQYKF